MYFLLYLETLWYSEGRAGPWGRGKREGEGGGGIMKGKGKGREGVEPPARARGNHWFLKCVFHISKKYKFKYIVLVLYLYIVFKGAVFMKLR